VANLSLPAAAAVWGVSPRTAYRLAELGLVRIARFGRRLTIPAEEVERVRVDGVSAPPPSSPPLAQPPRPGGQRGPRRPKRRPQP
jgi:hypothetical protein